MKITVEMDCTPEEARRFFGLPDVAPLQQAVMERLQARVEEAASATSAEALMRSWMPFAPQMPEAFLRAMTGAMWPGAAPPEPPKGPGEPR
ncbi:DUF6489 family protein [Falsiroseomonas oryzae]|uniref:DUF6489 family protein n=1 Tax=Falsiroseomonas oryzae TaxID=2766473 RepID=UPI0022EB5586|nr:DUF6489 family protein [Roseomonas sp. MO-31]